MNNINQSYIRTRDHLSTEDSFCETNISWSAILIGALSSIGLSFLLNLFNISIGLTVISTSTIGNKTFAIGSLIGLFIGAIATMFFSGWLAGYLARPSYTHSNTGAIYGFSAWCLALLLTILTASYVGKFITDSSHLLPSSPTLSKVSTDTYNNTLTAPPAINNSEISNQAQSINTVGTGTFIIFVLFFVGALSSTIGGYCAGSGNRCNLK